MRVSLRLKGLVMLWSSIALLACSVVQACVWCGDSLVEVAKIRYSWRRLGLLSPKAEGGIRVWTNIENFTKVQHDNTTSEVYSGVFNSSVIYVVSQVRRVYHLRTTSNMDAD